MIAQSLEINLFQQELLVKSHKYRKISLVKLVFSLIVLDASLMLSLEMHIKFLFLISRDIVQEKIVFVVYVSFIRIYGARI